MHNVQVNKQLKYNLMDQLVHTLLLLLFFKMSMVQQTLSIAYRQLDAYDLIGLVLLIKLQWGNDIVIIIIIVIDNGILLIHQQ